MIDSVNQISDEKFEKLSGYLDGELTQQEAQKVALQIESDPEYKLLYQELSTMRTEIQSLSLQQQELEHLEKLFEEPVAKTSRIFGFALLTLSAIGIVAYTLFKIFTNPEIGLLEKVLVGAMGGGSLLLLISVIRQRLISLKSDKYRRVKI
ncbi:anti-sigma factor [Aliikangiella sp. G2MR2-5]|uniref:anti-sigma factor family protein n=1 Tax=Aliikangiella sp. G2MR2-5 TaxID=2788943 RepID=UPI0018AB7B50|nr:hypothetical protein [Aliikangiella sp. G2MR2-5]